MDCVNRRRQCEGTNLAPRRRNARCASRKTFTARFVRRARSQYGVVFIYEDGDEDEGGPVKELWTLLYATFKNFTCFINMII